jgi:hypothetical protein
MICSCWGGRETSGSNSFFDLGDPTSIRKRASALLGTVRDDCHLDLQLDGNRRDVFDVDLSTSSLAERERLLLSNQDERDSPG